MDGAEWLIALSDCFVPGTIIAVRSSAVGFPGVDSVPCTASVCCSAVCNAFCCRRAAWASALFDRGRLQQGGRLLRRDLQGVRLQLEGKHARDILLTSDLVGVLHKDGRLLHGGLHGRLLLLQGVLLPQGLQTRLTMRGLCERRLPPKSERQDGSEQDNGDRQPSYSHSARRWASETGCRLVKHVVLLWARYFVVGAGSTF